MLVSFYATIYCTAHVLYSAVQFLSCYKLCLVCSGLSFMLGLEQCTTNVYLDLCLVLKVS